MEFSKTPATLNADVAARLRAVQRELGLTNKEMARLAELGDQVSTWSQYVSDKGSPVPARVLITLCQKKGLTLDWFYRGIGDMMPVRRLIRLEALLQGLDPDTAGPEVVGQSLSPVIREPRDQALEAGSEKPRRRGRPPGPVKARVRA